MSVLKHVTEDRHVADCECGWLGPERDTPEEADADCANHGDDCEESECP